MTMTRAPSDKILCPDCHEPLLEWSPHCEEVLHAVVDGDPDGGKVHGTQRSFIGKCPTHGIRIASFMGHHTTTGPRSRPELEKKYYKYRKELAAALDEADRAKFRSALRGFHLPSAADLARWDAAMASL